MHSKVKLVAISIITIILLYFLWRKYRLHNCLEKFDAVFTPEAVLYNQETIDKEGHLGVVYLEFIYKQNPECSITRQFLSGCCAPILSTDYTGDDINDGVSKILVGQDSKYYDSTKSTGIGYYKVNDKPTHITGKHEDVGKPQETLAKPSNVYKGMNYQEGNTCNPVTYYADEICNLSKESTLFHLKKVIEEINKNYNLDIYSQITPGEQFTYQNSFQGTPIDYDMLKKEGILGVQGESNLPKLFHFHLAIKLIPDTTGAEDGYPVLKLKIPKLKENDKIDYDTVVYRQNVNNIDQVMEFIYMNVVVNVENITDSDGNEKKRLTLFDTYYDLGEEETIDMTVNKNPYDMQKYSLYSEKRIFTFSRDGIVLPATNVKTKTGDLRPNFIKDKYFSHKGGLDPIDKTILPYNQVPKLHFIHHRPQLRDIELKGQVAQEDNYLVTRPNMYWEDVGTITSASESASEFIDYTHIVILLEDINLTEYYEGIDNPQNLVYWFAWNISKLELSILRKKLPDLLSDTESFSQMYPYQLIKNKDNAFFVEEEMFISGLQPTQIRMKRNLNLRARIVPVTYEANNKLNILYQNYLNRKYLDITLFYQRFFKSLKNIITNYDDYYIKPSGIQKYRIPDKVMSLDKIHDTTLRLNIKNWQEILNKQGRRWTQLFLIKEDGKEWYDKKTKTYHPTGLIFALYMYVENYKDGEKNKKRLRLSPRVGKHGVSSTNDKIGLLLSGNEVIINQDGIYTFVIDQTAKVLSLDFTYPDSTPLTSGDLSNSVSGSVSNIIIESCQHKNYYIESLAINTLTDNNGSSSTDVITELNIVKPTVYQELQHQQLSVPFELESQKLKESYTNFYKNTTYRDKHLTLFNYGNIRYEIDGTNKQVIHLPYDDYYEILVIDTDSKDKVQKAGHDIPGTGKQAPNSLIEEKYGTNEYHEYLKTYDFTGIESDVILTVDNNDFSPVDGDFTYRIPYKTKTIQVSSSRKVDIIIRLNPYPTQRFIWNRFITDKSKIDKQSNNDGLELSGDTHAIKISLSRHSNFMVNFRAIKKTPRGPDLQIMTTEDIKLINSTNDNFYTFLNLNQPPQTNFEFTLKNGQNYKLYDGTITFLPDNFNIQEYRLQQFLELESFGAARVKTAVIPYKMRCAKNRTKLSPHQILPTLQWKTDLPKKKLFYAVEASYLKSDGTKKPLYLAWDILPTDTQHQYQIFPSYRKNRKEDFKNKKFKFNQHDLIHDYGPVDKNTPPDVFYQDTSVSHHERHTDLKDVNLGRKFVSIEGRDCEVINGGTAKQIMSEAVTEFTVSIPQIKEYISGKYQIIENGAGEKVLEITEAEAEADTSTNTLKVTEKKLSELQEAKDMKKSIQIEKTAYSDNIYVVKTGGNARKFEEIFKNKEFAQDSQLDSTTIINKFKYYNKNWKTQGKKCLFQYNKTLGIWQIFIMENGVEIWIANQAKPQNLLDPTTDWLFSPDFHHENYAGKYDFFDFPNQFNRNVKIRPNVIDFTKKVKLSITTTTTTSSNIYNYDCHTDKSNISLRAGYQPEAGAAGEKKFKSICNELNLGKFNYRYFNTTLFNIPNVSETDEKGQLINLDSSRLSVDEEGDMFMEVPVRIKIFPYLPNTSGPSDMIMSHAVRKQYLDTSVVNAIKDELLKKIKALDLEDCSDKAYKYFIEEIQDEILAQRGDLDKVFFQEIFESIMNPSGGEKMKLNLSKFNSLDDIPNRVRTKKVIHDNKELSSQIIKLFEKYTKNKIHPKNYYSYGNYELLQNETIVSYQVPLEPKCYKIYQGNYFAENRNPKVLFLIQKSIFYKNTRLIKSHLDTIDKFISLEVTFEPYTYQITGEASIFSKEVLKLYSTEIFKYLKMLKSVESLIDTYKGKAYDMDSAEDVDAKDAAEKKIISNLKNLLSQDFTSYNLLSQDDLTEGEIKKMNEDPDHTGLLQTPTSVLAGKDFTRDTTKPVECQGADATKIESNSNFLLRHIQVVIISEFYELLETELFNKDYEAAPGFLKDNEKLLKEINLKLEQYNNFVGLIYKEVCEKEMKPAEPQVITPTRRTVETEYKETDIYTYYKDMIFSIFDKDPK